MSIRILLVEDHTLLRETLREKLLHAKDIDAVYEAADGESAIEMMAKNQADVVLMDIELPGKINGIKATRQIITDYPMARIIALSAWEKLIYIKNVMAAGAQGYFLKECSSEELLQGIRDVMADADDFVFSRKVERMLAKDNLQDGSNAEDIKAASLTKREKETLIEIALGHSLKEIAAKRGRSRKTVEDQQRRAKKKLGLQSEADLTRFAIKQGWIDVDRGEGDKDAL